MLEREKREERKRKEVEEVPKRNVHVPRAAFTGGQQLDWAVGGFLQNILVFLD